LKSSLKEINRKYYGTWIEEIVIAPQEKGEKERVAVIRRIGERKNREKTISAA